MDERFVAVIAAPWTEGDVETAAIAPPAPASFRRS